MTALDERGPVIAVELRRQAATLTELADRLDGPAATDEVTLTSPGAALVVRERARQVEEEGHTTDTDAVHTGHEIAWAAWCFLDRAAGPGEQDGPAIPTMWPFPNAEWKPKPSRLRNLVIAAALVVAEIDRALDAGDRP